MNYEYMYMGWPDGASRNGKWEDSLSLVYPENLLVLYQSGSDSNDHLFYEPLRIDVLFPLNAT